MDKKLPSNKKLTSTSQRLRREMTKEERRLWYQFLKGLPVTVHRQKVVGNYILDFYCEEKKTAIEIDGAQHYEDKNLEYDQNRTEYLQQYGITVLRYSNKDINQKFKDVCTDILVKWNL